MHSGVSDPETTQSRPCSLPLPPQAITFNAAISSCERGGAWQMALSLIEVMAEDDVDMTAVSYGAAISACVRGGAWRA